MTISAAVKLTATEQELITVARKLPPSRLDQLIDFANFLVLQTQAAQEANGWNEDDSTFSATMQEDEEKWERLLARPEAQVLMHKMAQEAIEEHRAGRTPDIVVAEDGRLAPS